MLAFFLRQTPCCWRDGCCMQVAGWRLLLVLQEGSIAGIYICIAGKAWLVAVCCGSGRRRSWRARLLLVPKCAGVVLAAVLAWRLLSCRSGICCVGVAGC